MQLHISEILILAFLPLTLRTVLYLVACRVRSVHITLLNAIIVAGAASLIRFVPLPIPFLFYLPLVIGVAMFLLSRYTEAELFPDLFLIPIIVELSSMLLLEELLIPLVRH